MISPRFVSVTWLDAWADGLDDITSDNVHERHQPFEMETRGWLLLENDVGVSIFYERCLYPSSYRGRTFIPKAMIKSIVDFPPVKVRKKRVQKQESPNPE